MNLFCPSKLLVLTWVGLGRIIRGPFDLVLLRTGLEKPTGFLCVCLSTENVVVAWWRWGGRVGAQTPLVCHSSSSTSQPILELKKSSRMFLLVFCTCKWNFCRMPDSVDRLSPWEEFYRMCIWNSYGKIFKLYFE